MQLPSEQQSQDSETEPEEKPTSSAATELAAPAAVAEPATSATSATPAEPPPLPRRQAWLVLGIICLISFQTALSLSIIFIVFPELSTAFPEATNAQISWVVNIFNIVGAAILVLAGELGERWGRKRVIIWGTVGFMAASVLAALSPSVGVLVLARAIQALSSVATLPAGTAMLIAAFPQEQRGTAIGTWSAAGGIAAATGPLFGGFLVDSGGWQAAFWINVPLGVVALIPAVLFLPEYRRGFSSAGDSSSTTATTSREPLPDPLGSVIMALGISAIVLALVQTEQWQWLDARTLGVGAAGMAAVLWLLMRSARHPSPVLDLKLFKYSSFAQGNIAMMMLSFGFFAVQLAGIIYVTEIWDYDIRIAGLLSTPIFAFTGLGASIAGRLSDKLGAAKVVAPGGLIWLVALGWLALAVGEQPNVALWLWTASLGGVGSGLMWGGVFAATVQDLPLHSVALGSSVTQTVMRIGTSMGVAVAVTMIGSEISLDSVDAFRWTFAMAAAVCGAAGLMLLNVRLRQQQATVDEQ